ncbi:MAG: tripartite tricarboxylate transporter substrate binding protein [Burkholderiaceae bacterium]
MESSKRSLPTDRRALLAALAAGGLAPFVTPARAQAAWPTRPVAMVVGFPPGGQTDFAGRVVAAGMQGALGQSVVIENKAGVSGNIAAQEVMRAPPDGYRLLVGNGAMTISPHVYTSVQMVDPQKLVPIGVLLQSALMLVVPATSPVKTYKEFAERAVTQDKAGKSLDYGSGGVGSLVQVTMELLSDRLGVKLNHVPYKGSSPAMIDLVAGRIDAMFDAASVVAPFVKSGQLRPLFATGPQRVPAFPDVPTAAEAGVKDFEIISFIGLYGPPGLKGDVVTKVNAAMNTALKDPGVIKNITDRGDEPGGGTPEDLANLTRAHFKMWGEVVKANNIRAD